MANFDFDCADVNGIRFSDADVVNPYDFVPDGDYNPHRIRPWLFHDHGFVLGIVFASNLSDAFDELADGKKIEHLKVELSDYPESEFQSDYDGDEERLSCLGNHGEMYDTENVCFVEMRNPRFSFTALFVADEREKTMPRLSDTTS